MLANYDRAIMHYWAGRGFPIGHLVSYQDWSVKRVYPWLPLALDNGVFQGGDSWSDEKFFTGLDSCKLYGIKPRWVLVPDFVGDAGKTMERWEMYYDKVKSYGWEIGFALQDGVKLSDVPETADIVFIGGSMEWKLKNIRSICGAFPRVHVGRINTIDRVWYCHDCGAESIDGTGWFRDGEMSFKMKRLERYFNGERDGSCSLFTPSESEALRV